ncbi:MAG TPA: SpoIID/LytB domain-containing protein [Flavobacteriales bacterium]|nr:SpoIID/LytB domain-containing protein [Flavobacteriales bacterium]
MYRLISIWLFCIACHQALAQPINIGLFNASTKTKISFVPQNCNYLLSADSNCVDTLKAGALFTVSANPDSTLRMVSLDKDYGNFRELLITALDSTGEIKFKALVQNGKDKFFTGDFKFKVHKNNLILMNYLDIERYIEAVMESESGLGHTLEYYKVQAVISRTYARSNAFKHVKEEGFNLCDNTHCQAYKHKGKSNAVIVQAVRETKGIVMVDDSLRLITAAFHSNCGGQTSTCEMVWNKPLPYLKSVHDSYCVGSLNAYWQKQMTLTEWLAAFKSCGVDITNQTYIASATNYASSYRQYGIKCGDKTVPFKTLRAYFKLKSAFFNVSLLDANTVILQGRGFGHGVGLCQEGAMKMAKAGKSYKEILTHYFTNCHIVSSSELKDFSEE